MKKLFIAAAALAITGAASSAEPMRPTAPWTGFYIGINGGGVVGRTNTGVSAASSPVSGFDTPFFQNNFNSEDETGTVNGLGTNSILNVGGLFGGQIGYLQQWGMVVAGIEVGFDWMNARGSATTTNISIPDTFTFDEAVRAKSLFTALARIGIDMGAWYPYVTGGLASTRLEYTNSFQAVKQCFICAVTSQIGTATAELSERKIAAAFGAGLEWRLDNHWSLRGEYLHAQFTGPTGSSVATLRVPTFGDGNLSHTSKFNENIGRFAVNYRF
jgi:outer membrane immunogenic protein